MKETEETAVCANCGNFFAGSIDAQKALKKHQEGDLPFVAPFKGLCILAYPDNQEVFLKTNGNMVPVADSIEMKHKTFLEVSSQAPCKVYDADGKAQFIPCKEKE